MRGAQIRIRPAAEGLKAEIIISPSLLREALEQAGKFYPSEAVLEVDWPVEVERNDEGEFAYQLASLEFILGVEDDWPAATTPEWDDDTKGPAHRRD